MPARRRTNLLFSLDKSSKVPLYQQIYQTVRSAIAEGALVEGDRLPSIRTLCRELDVSHTTIEQAYLQLSVEGYVATKPRSGYVVEHVDTEFLSMPRKEIASQVEEVLARRSKFTFAAGQIRGKGARYNFSFADLRPGSFPADEWRSLVGEVLYASTAKEADRYAYADEPSLLSRELARYLGRTRGVRCVDEQVLATAGTAYALSTVLSLFDRRHDLFGMEEPGYPTAVQVAHGDGFDVVPLPITGSAEVYFAALDQLRPKILFATPSHQFPTGAVMSIDQRTRLIRWAEEHDAYIIEDDSCNEYRYDVDPLPSLQSLDVYDRVIYLGNLSKVLSPSLRVAYLVLPPRLLDRYLDRHAHDHPTLPWIEQEVLARFIGEGLLERQVRRMRRDMHRAHDLLEDALDAEFGDRIGLSGIGAGMHLYAAVDNGMSHDELLLSARAHDANVFGTKHMWFSKPIPEPRVMIGFSAIALEDIAPGVAALREAWLNK